MKIAIVAHIQRAAQAYELASMVDGFVLMDTEGRGAAWNHRRALTWAAGQSERVVVMEDDALPVPGFHEHAAAALGRWPDELVSLYLGTGRPPQWQPRINVELERASGGGMDWIELPQLIHGVAYSVPKPAIVLNAMGSGPADYAIGDAWRRETGRGVIYMVPSIVDHADGPSVEQHPDGQPRTERRRAWKLALAESRD